METLSKKNNITSSLMPLKSNYDYLVRCHLQIKPCFYLICLANCSNVAIYHPYGETNFYYFVPCQIVDMIHFEKA